MTKAGDQHVLKPDERGGKTRAAAVGHAMLAFLCAVGSVFVFSAYEPETARGTGLYFLLPVATVISAIRAVTAWRSSERSARTKDR